MPKTAPESIIAWLAGRLTGASAPPVAAAISTVLAGEDVANDRMITYELWDYEDNLTTSGAVKEGPGVLGVAQVVASDPDAVVTFYDFVASTEVPTPAGTETKLGVLVLATQGTQLRFGRPAVNGIWAEWTSTGGEIAVGTL